MMRSDKGAVGPYKNFEKQDETTKKGTCLLELRRTEMVHWGVCRQVSSDIQYEDNNPQPPAIVKEDKDNGEAVTVESPVLPQCQKRKKLSQLQEARTSKRVKQRQTNIYYNHKRIKCENSRTCRKENYVSRKENCVERWSTERYKRAERSMLEVMKAEGAVFENPIPRPALRLAARKCIGDTGLLDHLLKHIDGKVAPGGTERFRRCYNTEGVMEYWLESADLVKIKKEAGVLDPNWVPPSWWKPGGVSSCSSGCAGQLTLLKEEMAELKRDMEELVCKKQEQEQASPFEEMHKELVKWRSKTDQRLIEISTSLSSLQDMYKELLAWKSKTEQQVGEILSSLSGTQASKQCTTFSPASERWEDWLNGTNLDDIQGEDLAPWLAGTDVINVGQYATVQEPCSAPQSWLKPCDSPSQGHVCARELELLKEEMAKMKRDVQELAPKRVEKEQATVAPDSSATANPKLDFDNPLLLFKEMCKELVKWKAKMEQQMLEISNSVSMLQASKQYTI